MPHTGKGDFMEYNDPDFMKYMKPYNETPLVDTRYSIARVTKRFKDIYDLDVVKIDYGYKGYRYRRYVEYDVYNSDGKRIMHRLTLDAMAQYLIREGEYY